MSIFVFYVKTEVFWMIFISRLACSTLYYLHSNFIAKASKWDLKSLLKVYFLGLKVPILSVSFPSWNLKRILSPMGTQMGLEMLAKVGTRMGYESLRSIWGLQDSPSNDFGANLEPLWPLWQPILDWFWANSPLWTRQDWIHYVSVDASHVRFEQAKFQPITTMAGHGGGTRAHAPWIFQLWCFGGQRYSKAFYCDFNCTINQISSSSVEWWSSVGL